MLSTAALSLWPLRSEKSGRPADGAHPRAALALAAAAVLIRPTAAVQWALLGSLLLCCCACVIVCVQIRRVVAEEWEGPVAAGAASVSDRVVSYYSWAASR